MLQCLAEQWGVTVTHEVQMLVRAHVAANTGLQTLTGGPLSDVELQEGLMAGFGGRARRKHIQRHAARTGSQPSTQQMPDSTKHDASALQPSDTSDNEKQAVSSPSNGAALHISEQATAVAAEHEVEAVHSSSIYRQREHGAHESPSSETDKSLQNGPGAAAVCVEQSRPHMDSAAGREETQGVAAAAGLAAGAPATDSGRGGHFWHGERYNLPPLGSGRQCDVIRILPISQIQVRHCGMKGSRELLHDMTRQSVLKGCGSSPGEKRGGGTLAPYGTLQAVLCGCSAARASLQLVAGPSQVRGGIFAPYQRTGA